MTQRDTKFLMVFIASLICCSVSYAQSTVVKESVKAVVGYNVASSISSSPTFNTNTSKINSAAIKAIVKGYVTPLPRIDSTTAITPESIRGIADIQNSKNILHKLDSFQIKIKTLGIDSLSLKNMFQRRIDSLNHKKDSIQNQKTELDSLILKTP